MSSALVRCLGAAAGKDQGCQQEGTLCAAFFEETLTVPYCIQ